ncbi:MAG: hypothetical protein M1833_000806 [Piccolia ochrophora]|nr:MAG: hypothetical protein M1833_000806 [Piccolia ochrophora]
MPTYTQRYQRKTRKTPKLDTRPYVLKFFPKELWSTLDPEHSIEAGTAVASTKKRKTLTFATSSVNGFPEDKSGAHVTDDEQRLTALEQNGPTTEAVKAEDDNEDEMRLDDDEVGEEGEDVDEDFEEDEEDMGDDYNAEGYFDAGEEDEGAGGGDGDDEGGYYN